jgi:hypothetical protein
MYIAVRLAGGIVAMLVPRREQPWSWPRNRAASPDVAESSARPECWLMAMLMKREHSGYGERVVAYRTRPVHIHGSDALAM